MLFTNIIASALFIGSSLAAPHSLNSIEPVQMSPREYWAFAIKLRDGSVKEKRAPEADIAAREYWAFAIKLRDGVTAKRAILESQCEQAEEGIYCTYTSADIEAYGRDSKLQEGCVTTDTGVSCFYPGATPEDAASC
ncbi:uncharacterized protein TRIVIDRAFT_220232 [Trichoderma virens Gv29-8]|uniref:Uncharacterized protein n=1 Tax=Hypocrea virens (strain Gv29-8 / FGSC 10586) TaxID=413071 RepID=G9MKP5_HYPVG|nr:uncharacterized protein TRIVIDRAFT_220232 [Trichoderma virens Gv29-8]EHK24792.1 hypothetical protein TRIVIDRAFT_220232 [Trichoderma virens Gv29-8]